MFDAIGFDLGDTLVDYVGVPLSWQQEYPAALSAAASSLGCSLSDEALAAGVSSLVRFNTRVTPRSHEIDDSVVFGDVFSTIGLPCSVGQSSFDVAVDAFFSVFRGRALAVQDAALTVESVRRGGVGVGVLTDAAYGMPRRLVVDDLARAGLGWLETVTLTSVDVGRRKPHPKGYLALADMLGVPVKRMLYVGNERKDVEGAKLAGASAVLFWREHADAPDWGQDYVVTALPQLVALQVATGR